MKCINRHVSAGDTVEVGEIEGANLEQQNGNLVFQAVYSGDPSEHVVLKTRFDHGDDIQTRGEVLTVVSGSGYGNPVCYMLVPMDEYGGGDGDES
ncbi:hypothetical protein [Haloarchaeobius iranensis]|uniref:hypothetical protein n=1 Tax=Haloarchaeobius iranensis TaxID=996166 RepID=UPI001113DF3E|nr:hypothetical protein [Haloarchaeobius iranensis]